MAANDPLVGRGHREASVSPAGWLTEFVEALINIACAQLDGQKMVYLYTNLYKNTWNDEYSIDYM